MRKGQKLLAAILCAVVTGSVAQPIMERIEKGELTFMNDDEPAMREAFRKAQHCRTSSSG